MRVLVIFICLLVIFCAGCARTSSVSQEQAAVRQDLAIEPLPSKEIHSYYTPYGVIKEQSTPEEVRKILGNPHQDITTEKANMDVWYYYFDGIHLYIHFLDGKVVNVEKSEGGSDINEGL